jgi:hypothetical protein
MKKIAPLALATSMLAGCLASPLQPVVPASSQPATNASPNTDAAAAAATLAKETMPTKSSSLFGWLFPERLKDMTVPTGKTVVGMWMYNSDTDGEVKELAYNIAWMSKAQKLESFELTVNHIPAFATSDIVYNAYTNAPVTSRVPLGSSTYPSRFDSIIAWATIPERSGGMALQVTLDVTKVKRISTGEIRDPGVPAMAADAVIVKWWK